MNTTHTATRESLEVQLPEGPAPEYRFTLMRRFEAPRSLIYKSWTEPERMRQWWGPRGFTTPECEMDLRPGGAYRIVMRSPEGIDYPLKGQYREAVDSERLVYTDDWEEHPTEWHETLRSLHHGTEEPAHDSLNIVTFEAAEDGGTLLTITTFFETIALRDAMVKLGMAEGWNESLDRLQESLALTIIREFEAPRELVYEAWTDTDRLMKWWGPKDYEMRSAKMDLRKKGLLHYRLRSPDGVDMWGRFVFDDKQPLERLIFIDSFSDEEGGVTRNPASSTWPLEMMNILTFFEREGRTTLMLTAVPHSATPEEWETFDEGREGMQDGYAGTLDQLDEYLKDIARTK